MKTPETQLVLRSRSIKTVERLLAEEVLRLAVAGKASRSVATGSPLRLVRLRRLSRLVRRLAYLNGADPARVLVRCGRILSGCAEPARRSRPRAYLVTSRLVGHLFGLSPEALVSKPPAEWGAVERYYAMLLVEEWLGARRSNGCEEG